MASGLPDVVGAAGNLPALGVETVADLAVSCRKIRRRRGASINDPGDPETDSSGGDDGSGGRGRFGGGGGNDDYGKWYFEDPDSRRASNFHSAAARRASWWILLCARSPRGASSSARHRTWARCGASSRSASAGACSSPSPWARSGWWRWRSSWTPGCASRA